MMFPNRHPCAIVKRAQLSSSANHEEEQSMELEALEAIYADLFSVVSQRGEGAPLEWKVHLEPTEGGEGEVNHGGWELN